MMIIVIIVIIVIIMIIMIIKINMMMMMITIRYQFYIKPAVLGLKLDQFGPRLSLAALTWVLP